MDESGPLIAHLENAPLQTDVKSWDRILANDPIFRQAEDLRAQYRLEANCVKNLCRLATGYQGMPVVLMQNPCNSHTKDFDEMFTQDCALSWLRNAFDEIGFDLEHDIPLWDICPLFSDEWMQNKAQSGQFAEVQQAIFQAYELTMRYLEALQPPAVFVMQCATNRGAAMNHPFLGSVNHPLAQALSSSMKEAAQGRCRIVRVLQHQVYMIPGFHPSRITRETDPSQRRILATTLKRNLSDVYLPYAQQINGLVSKT
ncbi:hypothetical protein CDV55_106529 [Aspergillus turcosus]|nr:hypothetical protein CDV55_106529 [Aspergillus turcosus]